jgi:hypothetical protein
MAWKTLINSLCEKKGSWIFTSRGTLHTSPVHSFSEDSGTTLKAAQEGGNGIESTLKGSVLLEQDLEDTPGGGGGPSSGWEWSWAAAPAIKCCLPENNVFKMVIAGHVRLSRDRSWPRLLTRNSYCLPVSATVACVLSGSGREQGALKVHFRCRPRLSGCD